MSADAQILVPAAAPRLPSAPWLILGRELRANLKSLLSWSLPMAALLVLYASLQASLSGDGGLLEAKLAAMPETMRKALGFQGLSLTRPVAYLATNFLTVTLTSALFGGILGATLVSKEETFHTAELLLTLPVSRAQVLLGKAGALALLVVAFQSVLALTALLSMRVFVPGNLEAGLALQLFAGALLLGLCFGGLGMGLATWVRQSRVAPSAALALVFGSYALGLVSHASERLEALRWLAPFRFVEPSEIVRHGGLDPLHAGGLLLLGAAGLAVALIRFGRKDVHA